MDDKLVTAVILIALTVLALLAPTPTHADDPLATAQAAEQQARQEQWRANQASQAARSARATADAAYTQATAQAMERQATAQWIATATPAAATAQAQATREALEVEATQQAISAEATTAAYYHQAIATAQAQALLATATQHAAWAEMDRLEIQRGRAWQPLCVAGPWLVTVALVVTAGALLWRVAGAGRGECHDEIIEGEYRLLLPETVEPRPCVLRPIERWQSRRPASD